MWGFKRMRRTAARKNLYETRLRLAYSHQMNAFPAQSISDIYHHHPVYSRMPLESRRGGVLPVDILRVTQCNFSAIDPATHAFCLGMKLGGDATGFAVDFGDGKKYLKVANQPDCIYLNPTSGDTQYEQDGALALQFVSVPYAQLSKHFDLGEANVANALVPYHDDLFEHAGITQRLRELWHLSQLDGPAGSMAMDHSMLTIAATLLAQVGVVSNPSLAEARLTASELRRVAVEIDDRLEDALSLDDLATLVGRSTYSFCRAFRQTTGMSPYQYVIKQRLRRAEEMLRRTNAPLSEIAYACGFSSQPHFSQTFGKHYRLSPGRFRRAYCELG